MNKIKNHDKVCMLLEDIKSDISNFDSKRTKCSDDSLRFVICKLEAIKKITDDIVYRLS